MTKKFLTMAQGATADLDALKRQAARERIEATSWTPKVPVARIGIDPGSPEGDRGVSTVLQGALLLHTLQPGEDWRAHPAGGIIVVHPERDPLWVREVDGEVVKEVLTL
jgi:hypothetical protein